MQLAVWYQSFCTCNKLFPHIFTCFFLGLQEIDKFCVPVVKNLGLFIMAGSSYRYPWVKSRCRWTTSYQAVEVHGTWSIGGRFIRLCTARGRRPRGELWQGMAFRGGEDTTNTGRDGRGKREKVTDQKANSCVFFCLYRVIFFGAFNGCCPAISKRRKRHISF